ncbi:MAG TPA: primosomal replication protein N [Burkholderiales bacterium]|nr:primosomal replication protein N [Burkholderiales bacterium]
MELNEVTLTGELTAVEPLRYTPAGIPLLNFRLLHRSQQVEARVKRQVECEMQGVALADVALVMSTLRSGQSIKVNGFLNRKSRMSAQVVLHATGAEYAKESNHGDGKVRTVQVQR